MRKMETIMYCYIALRKEKIRKRLKTKIESLNHNFLINKNRLQTIRSNISLIRPLCHTINYRINFLVAIACADKTDCLKMPFVLKQIKHFSVIRKFIINITNNFRLLLLYISLWHLFLTD